MSKRRNTRKKKILTPTMTIAEVEEFFLKEFLKLQRSKAKKQQRGQSIDGPTPADAWADGCKTAPAAKFVKPTLN